MSWWGALFGLSILNFFVYRHFFGHFFYSDDFVWMHFGELVKSDPMNMFRLHVTSFFSPVVNAYFYLGQLLYPFNSVVYHAVGLGIHVLNSFLVWIFIKQLTRRIDAAYVGAVFFAVAMYHYEAVIWISSIMHVLVTSFVLFGLIAYAHFLKTGKMYLLLASLLSGLFAFFTKENGIVFPVMIMTVFFYHHFYFQTKNSAKHLWFFIAELIGLFVYTYIKQRHSIWIGNGVYTIDIRAIYPLIASTLAVFAKPFVLIMIKKPIIIAGVSLIAACLVGIRYKKDKESCAHIILGIIFLILGFAPVMFFYFGTWHTIAQYRYSYLPTIGGALVLAGVYLMGQRLSQKRIVTSSLILVFLLYIGYNIRSNYRTYENDYRIIDEQMRGMVTGFRELEPILTKHHNIVLVGNYPFRGNEYYRFLYRYFVDPTQKKSIDDWRSEPDEALVREQYQTDMKYLLLGWDNPKRKIYLIP